MYLKNSNSMPKRLATSEPKVDLNVLKVIQDNIPNKPKFTDKLKFLIN